MELVFGKRLRELRLDKGLTQKQLGEIFNIDQTRISNWENQDYEPSLQTLIDFAKFFGVTVGQLLGVEEY